MSEHTDWFATGTFLIIIVILALLGCTLYVIHRAKKKTDRRRDSFKEGVRAALQASDDGKVYTLLQSVNARGNAEKDDGSQSELTVATHALMWWTAALACVTFFMAYFTGFTLVAIRGQLQEMREAGIDTRKLAIAAEDQARTAKASARPYVFIEFTRV